MINKLNRRDFLSLVGKGLCGASIGAGLINASICRAGQRLDKKPNFVFIFADDLGWGDLGCYGNERVKTPYLDKLAEQGSLFTQFYVNASVCSPSRAAIMTGRFPAELGIHGHFGLYSYMNKERNMPDYLDQNITNLTGLLQQNGYTTGHFGKWHLGGGRDYKALVPGKYGLDEFATVSSNDPNAGEISKIWQPEYRHVETQMIMGKTLDFIQENQGGPFYVNAWLTLPHAPLNPSEEQMDVYRDEFWANANYNVKDSRKQNSKDTIDYRTVWEIYYGTLTEIDKQIGLFLKKLEQMGLADDTVIIFSSDNGPESLETVGNAAYSAVGSTGPFRGRKRSLYEGGVRMPFLVRWPGKIPAGKINNTSIVSGVDFLPTICSMADIKVPENLDLDGEDMSDAILGKTKKRTKPLMWESRIKCSDHIINRSPTLAIREDKWKLLMNSDKSRIELYDIPNDPAEMNNLVEQNPEIVKRLSQKLLKWHSKLPEGPLQPGAGENNYPLPDINND